jgi:hypothetical protein
VSSSGDATSAKWDSNATIGCLISIAILGGIIWLIVAVFFGGDDEDSPERPSSQDQSIGAWIACQQRMDANLKAPASAGYPLISELAVDKVGTTYTFPSAWVDAQNSFGAQIRTFFSCTAIDYGDSWSVRVTVLK